MLSKTQVEEIAITELKKLSVEFGVELVLYGAIERKAGKYLVAFNSRAWVENGDIGACLVGNFPFSIDCITGEIEKG